MVRASWRVIFVEMFRTTIGEDGFMVLKLTLRHKGVGIKQIRDPGSPRCDR